MTWSALLRKLTFKNLRNGGKKIGVIVVLGLYIKIEHHENSYNTIRFRVSEKDSERGSGGGNYEIVKWDASGSHSLICTNFNKQRNITTACTYTFEGKYVGKNKESDFDLQLVVPEYLTWKEGDYLTVKHDSVEYVIIFKDFVPSLSMINYHASYRIDVDFLDFDSNISGIMEITPSEPDDIQVITDVLRLNGKRWNPETKQVEDVKKESKPEHEFKLMDLCLARFSNVGCWNIVQFGLTNSTNRSMTSVGGLSWTEWIPYKGNEHLLGTTNKPEE